MDVSVVPIDEHRESAMATICAKWLPLWDSPAVQMANAMKTNTANDTEMEVYWVIGGIATDEMAMRCVRRVYNHCVRVKHEKL